MDFTLVTGLQFDNGDEKVFERRCSVRRGMAACRNLTRTAREMAWPLGCVGGSDWLPFREHSLFGLSTGGGVRRADLPPATVASAPSGREYRGRSAWGNHEWSPARVSLLERGGVVS